MNDLPAFDEVHVVSDLHLGGRAGFQGFRETARLAAWIRRLAALRPGARIALVLNGDVFDTLAEDIAGCIATDEAADTVARIIEDPAFAPVWQALAGFTRQPGRRLVLVIGNHDLELALPAVQRLLLQTLAGDDPSARARLEFSAAGGGYACRVGFCRVFCTHGNEVDAWNYTRYEDLSRLVRRLNAGLATAPSDWRPAAGTRLVKEVMNRIKRRYAWIDLLKPEDSAAIGVLLVLDPGQAGQLLPFAGAMAGARHRGRGDAARRLSSAGAGLAVDRLRRDEDGLPADPLRAAEHDVPADPPRAGDAGLDRPGLDWPGLGPNLRAGLAGRGTDAAGRSALPGLDPDPDGDDLLVIAERHLASPPRHETPDIAQPLLGPTDGWRQLLQRLAPSEALRLALLDWLDDDRSFDAEVPDDTSRRICASASDAIDFIVAGHTHLERAIDRGDGRAYFNTGTWMRLLRLAPEVLATRESFAPIWAVLADGSLQAIDAARTGSGEPLVMDRSSVVVIRLEDDSDQRLDAGAGAGAGADADADADATADADSSAGADAVRAAAATAGAGRTAGRRVIGELLHVEGDGSGEPRPIRRFVRSPGR